MLASVIRPHQPPTGGKHHGTRRHHRDVRERNQAYSAARDIDKLDDSVIDVQAGAIVEKDMLGNVTWLDSEDLTGPWGTIGGATGALLGALVGTSPVRPAP